VLVCKRAVPAPTRPHKFAGVRAANNLTEILFSKALDRWAYWNGVELDFSRPAKPVDNTVIEAFNGTLRRECLSLHWFLGLEDLQRTLAARCFDRSNRTRRA